MRVLSGLLAGDYRSPGLGHFPQSSLHCPLAPSAHSLPNPTSWPLGPNPTWPSAGVGRRPGPSTLGRTSGLAPRPRPLLRGLSPPALPAPACSLRSAGGPEAATGGSSRAPSSGRSRFQFQSGPRWLRRERGRPGSPGPPPSQVPSSACSPYQSDGLPCRGRAGAAPRVPLNWTGAETQRFAQTHRGAPAAGSGETRGVSCGGRRVGVGARRMGGTGKEERNRPLQVPSARETPLLPQEESLLFLL